jgi:hypothetical protein
MDNSMSTNELVHIGSQEEQALMAQGGLGLDSNEPLKPTPIKIKQPTTVAAGVENGKFFDTLTGQTFDSLDMVPIHMFSHRKKYLSDTFKRGDVPICRSRDGIKPITDNPDLQPQAMTCATCPHASWKNYDRKTKKGKPTCKEFYRIVHLEKESGLPFFIDLTGKAVSTGKMAFSAIKRTAQMLNTKFQRAGNNRRLSIFDFVLRTSVVPAEDGGPYFSFKVNKIDPMSATEAQQFGPLYMELIQRKADLESMEAQEDVVEGEIIEGDDTAGTNEAV